MKNCGFKSMLILILYFRPQSYKNFFKDAHKFEKKLLNIVNNDTAFNNWAQIGRSFLFWVSKFYDFFIEMQ